MTNRAQPRFLARSFLPLALLALTGCSAAVEGAEGVGNVGEAACSGVTLTPSPAAPQNAGTSVTLTASNTTCASGETAEYRFAYQRNGSSSPYTEIRTWGTNPVATWDTTGLPSGKYDVIVYSRVVGSTANYQSFAYATYYINSVCLSGTLSRSPAPPQAAGTPVDLTATGNCTSGGTPEFRFLYKQSTASAYTEIRTWGSGNVTWNTTGLPDGTYSLLMYVRAAGNTSGFEGYAYSSYQLGSACNSVTLSTSPSSPEPMGTIVTVTGAATCGSGLTPEYRFYFQKPDATWTLIRDWGAATANWNTSGLSAGLHTLLVQTRAVENGGASEGYAYQQYSLVSVGYSQLAVGGFYTTCALVNDGTARCWGLNDSGQIGDGTTTDKSTPAAVSGLTNVKSIAVGWSHSCAALGDGTARCWGDNSSGQLGNGTKTNSATPVVVSGISDATAVSAGAYSSCALHAGGTVSCWGDNGFGQLGNGTYGGTPSLTPVLAVGVTGAVEISVGSWHACARINDGTVKCWGLNDKNELGRSTTGDRDGTPAAAAGAGFTSISAGDSHTCGASGGAAWCWGDNTYGQLGDGTTTGGVIRPVSGLGNVTQVSAGFAHSCARLADSSAHCWGSNSNGQLGNGTTTDSLVPVTVTGISTASSAFAAGGFYSCAVLSDGTGKTWGYNANGQLGNGTLVDSSTPVIVGGP